ncbi:hypothetical protein RHGRI_004700 [Rhododendron griersonianum]|uniref:Uncharacterized protein n=1 Tax=Rhododendron griersonianum TaxID=479676 RepID=A0AAV6LAD0_9ERIC|nr:hypothetical protein RHGRI_004700 [Rhododendron griersonianum]
MEAASEGEKKPKRQMKTPYQLEILEKTYALETYPSEEIRVDLSEKLGLTDRQLQMWFCHRRLKDKKDMEKAKTDNFDSTRDEFIASERGGNHGSRFGSGSGSASGSGSGSSHFEYGDGVPMEGRYYGSPRSVMESRVIACVEAQLGEPLREDGPILGMEFDELPPGAFGAPIVMAKQPEQSFGECDLKPIKAGKMCHREYLLDSIKSDAYEGLMPYNLYDSPVGCPGANASLPLLGNGQLSCGFGVQGRVPSQSLSSQLDRKGHFSSPSGDNNCTQHMEVSINMQMDAPDYMDPVGAPEIREASDRNTSKSKHGLSVEKKRKYGRKGKEVDRRGQIDPFQTNVLYFFGKRDEQIRREMEKQEREKRKEEERMMREKQRQQERFQREERRENERREKFLQKESLKAERRQQKEELRREKEEARLKAASERATTRRLARESMELIEDDRLELMELAASSKGLPSIVSLDHDTMQNLESFRDSLASFPPESVLLKRPFSVPPWTDSEENIGDLLMVWSFCMTFADVLELWPFTLDELVQGFHDYDSRLLGEIHIALLKSIIKDIEDVARTPSTVVGTNQYSSANPEGGHPRIVEGAYLWGFDICHWKNRLNPLTWPEILRQFALSAGFGPRLKKKRIEKPGLPDHVEAKGCEDIVSILRNGSAAENAVAIMQEKGFPLQRRSRHRLTPGTVKFAAYHVLSLEGSKGMNVLDLAKKIQKSGLRDLTSSKTPEASISVALSRDPVLFERIAPSTYCVRLPFRKDPDDSEAILAAAREKIKRYENGFLAGENKDPEDVEREDDSEGEGADEGPEVHDLGTPNANQNSSNSFEFSTCSGNGKESLVDDVTLNLQNEPYTAGTLVNQFVDVSGKENGASVPGQGDTEIDESKSGQPWVLGLTEGEYSDLSVEERLRALDRLDAANALKKQMLAEAHLDKKRIKDESIPKFHSSSFAGNDAEIKQNCAAAESSQSPLTGVDNSIYDPAITTTAKEEPFIGADRILVEPEASMGQIGSSNQQNGYAAERTRLQLKSYIGHRAEEMYVYRSLPLGLDRRRNRYWQFVASASRHDPGSGRIFFESPDGYWRLFDSEEAFDALLASLDTRGIRESHLHTMLEYIEKSFKESLRRHSQSASIIDRKGSIVNEDAEMDCSPAQDSPSSTVSGSNSNTCEPSFSFKIELGKNETEKKAVMERYQEFQRWMWKECFDSSTLCAMRYGEKRCRPLMGICDFCLDSFMVSVPSEGLQSSWMEQCRKAWGIKLHASLSAEDLLQILTEFEVVIKRGFLSTNFETTDELLASSAVSGRGANPGSVPQLPWIPQTTAAVSLRLLELDGSISYNLDLKVEILENKEGESFTTSGYSVMKNIEDFEQPEADQDGHMREKNSTGLTSVYGSKKYGQGIRGRFRGRSQKRVSGSGRRNLSIPLTHVLRQHGERAHGQRLGRGRRTVRRRREEKMVIDEMLPSRLGNEAGFQSSGWESPRNSGGEEEEVEEDIQPMQIEGAEKSNSLEPVESSSDDDNNRVVEYEYAKWGTGNLMVMSDEDLDGSEEDNDLEEMGGGNFERVVDMNEDSDGNANEEGSTESADSEEYSD